MDKGFHYNNKKPQKEKHTISKAREEQHTKTIQGELEKIAQETSDPRQLPSHTTNTTIFGLVEAVRTEKTNRYLQANIKLPNDTYTRARFPNRQGVSAMMQRILEEEVSLFGEYDSSNNTIRPVAVVHENQPIYTDRKYFLQ